jgi:hypothetical protein
LLLRLSEVSREISPNEAADFARQSFQTASLEMAAGWNRVAMEKNSVTSMSRVDPAGAIHLLASVENPVKDDKSEDVRDSAADVVFPNYYRQKGLKSIAVIRRTSLHLGDTGQYPYKAIGTLEPEIYQKSRIAGVDLAGDAIRYYRRGSEFQTENRDFVAFLQSTGAFLPPSILKEAVTLAFERLQADRAKPHPDFIGRLITSKGSIQIKSSSTGLLAELLPLLRETDPELLTRTLDQDGDLKAISDLGQQDAHVESLVVFGAEASSPDPRVQTEGMEAGRLTNILMTSANDPDGALSEASTLTLTKYHIQGLAAAAGGFGSSDPAKGERLLQTASLEMEQLTKESDKLAAAGEVALAAIRLKDGPVLLRALDTVYSLGEELFEEDSQSSPTAMAYTRPGFREVLRTTRLLGWSDEAEARSRAGTVRNNVLKAYILAELAAGVIARQKGHEPELFTGNEI